MKENKSISEWFKEHKKGVIVAGATVTTIAVAILITKNWDFIKEITADRIFKSNATPNTIPAVEHVAITEIAETTITSHLPIKKITDVSEYIRNLPEGWHASASKIATAADNGFELADRQTWVNSFTRTYAA